MKFVAALVFLLAFACNEKKVDPKADAQSADVKPEGGSTCLTNCSIEPVDPVIPDDTCLTNCSPVDPGEPEVPEGPCLTNCTPVRPEPEPVPSAKEFKFLEQQLVFGNSAMDASCGVEVKVPVDSYFRNGLFRYRIKIEVLESNTEVKFNIGLLCGVQKNIGFIEVSREYRGEVHEAVLFEPLTEGSKGSSAAPLVVTTQFPKGHHYLTVETRDQVNSFVLGNIGVTADKEIRASGFETRQVFRQGTNTNGGSAIIETAR